MKRKKWELMVGGELADRFTEYAIDAVFRARQLSELAPLLAVDLREGWGNNIKSVATWRKGKEVKP